VTGAPAGLLRRLDLPPVWGAGFAAVVWAWADAVEAFPFADWAIWPGRALIAAGLGWIVWAALEFLRADTPIEPRRTPRALLTGGPFRHTRNPIYRGLVWILAGWAVSCGEATGLVFVAAYAWVLILRFALPEAAAVEAAFGDLYRGWAARTRWII
jgi:protein-S-isoprenylcysteine O-methyltransferase Ste14